MATAPPVPPFATSATSYPANPMSAIRDSWGPVPTAKDTHMLFYDVESLNNIYTVSIYNPDFNVLSLFFLCDDENIEQQINGSKARQHILKNNPYITSGKREVKPENIHILNLKNDEAHQTLCWLLGLTSVNDVNLTEKRAPAVTANPSALNNVGRDRLTQYGFLSDTHPEYDHRIDWTIAGYNSFEYDTTIMAHYFHEMESQAYRYIKYLEDCQQVDQNNIKNRAEDRNPEPYPAPPETNFTPTTAETLRRHNDVLFNAEGRMSSVNDRYGELGRIRLAMINSGRYLDVALLNEAQKFVSLKRLSGMLGYQIFESEKLAGPNATVESIEEFYDLLAYNANDTINLYRLFRSPMYSNNYDLKSSLIHRFPETVFLQNESEYKPDICSTKVDPWRLRCDSTSAQIVQKFLAPYNSLQDMPVVSFMYPSEEMAKRAGIERVNVLDYIERRFNEVVGDINARRQLSEAFAFYRNIEGKNFNNGKNHMRMLEKQGIKNSVNTTDPETGQIVAYSPADLPAAKLNVPYFTAQGAPTNCYVTFSIGGIHGAELNQTYRDRKIKDFLKRMEILEKVKTEFPDATEMRKLCGKQEMPDQYGRPLIKDNGKPLLTGEVPLLDENDKRQYDEKTGKLITRKTNYIRLSDGTWVAHKDVLATGSTIKNGCTYKELVQPDNLDFIIEKETTNRPNPEFTFTSVDTTQHEDFTSYYPSLFTNQATFYNERLGVDRYVEMYDEKKLYGDKKSAARAAGNMESFERYDLLQKGTKLILNSATGAAGMPNGERLRLNNHTLAMRLMGQMFAWWLGQAQTFYGAKVVSTNTDGLYVIPGPHLNVEQLLINEAKQINVEIEPEEMLLVSKDSNNRLEIVRNKGVGTDVPLTFHNTEVEGASGGTLACFKGPNPSKSLAHAAITDHLLVTYLSEIALLQYNTRFGGHHVNRPLLMTKPFNKDRARTYIDRLLGKPLVHTEGFLELPPMKFDSLKALEMFQTMVTASRGSMTYPYAATFDDDGNIIAGQVLQDVNRVFFIKENASIQWPIVHLIKAHAAKIAPVRLEKMRENNTLPIHGVNSNSDPLPNKVSYEILHKKGLRSIQQPYNARDGKLTEYMSNVIPNTHEVKSSLIPGIDPKLNMIIVNEDLECMDEPVRQEILNALDLDVYLSMAESTFDNTWRNKV